MPKHPPATCSSSLLVGMVAALQTHLSTLPDRPKVPVHTSTDTGYTINAILSRLWKSFPLICLDARIPPLPFSGQALQQHARRRRRNSPPPLLLQATGRLLAATPPTCRHGIQDGDMQRRAHCRGLHERAPAQDLASIPTRPGPTLRKWETAVGTSERPS